ncbi:MAG: hypothetical protein IIV62_06630, partial [Anaerotignum sp.]|nr:hypothetical protein [Anaerotignum sp.]
MCLYILLKTIITLAVAVCMAMMMIMRRFYNLGFNIEATEGTAKYLKENGIRTHVLQKISEGSGEILDSIRQGHIAYVINTSEIGSSSS